ncbi:hypothetical protein PHYSODRAFT_532487 [Phytophthora sojae]|uniref:HTH CENPB-type domain-containing protein n=1 Tax=Phytophthora sojae (strain P6497) TaxID=1094619 RepID=G5AFD7_PHYSP|nr:hypothetical protein PHYSODRAFT_532487 [Phytophthora sojae]EGZ05927.1 hypothetical protein PHYSODRAFT_532487 [Phytophthora sojae]|eukprot:XP_009538788.1 hypothetical protein PHYSODRAFT_532487 [Phytophthora sojae]
MTKGRQKHSKHGGRRARQYKRSAPTHQFRLDVVIYFETNSMASTFAKFFADLTGSQRQTKRTGSATSDTSWCKDKLLQLCTSPATAKQRKVHVAGTETTLPAGTEVHLVKWMNSYRAHGLSVSNLMMNRKALSVVRDAGVPARLFAQAGSKASCVATD